jgi:hypothetical protein
MGRRSGSIQGNGDVRVCVQGSGRSPSGREIRERGEAAEAVRRPIRQPRPSTPPPEEPQVQSLRASKGTNGDRRERIFSVGDRSVLGNLVVNPRGTRRLIQVLLVAVGFWYRETPPG